MNKFNEFIFKFYNSLSKFLQNDLVKKIISIIFAFLFGMSVGGCIESCISVNNEKQETISLTSNNSTIFNYDIDSDYFRFEIGETSLAYFSSSSQTGSSYSSIFQSIPLFTNIEIDTSFDNAYQFTIGFGTFDSPIDNIGARWVRYWPSVSFMSTSDRYDVNYVNSGHSVYFNIGSRYVELQNSYFIRNDGTNNSVFGYEFPISARTITSGLSGAADNDFMLYNFSTYYFISTNNLNTSIDRSFLVSYSIAYYDMTSVIGSTSNFFGSYSFALPLMKVHLFEFDNGDVFAYGYSTLGRYKPQDGLPSDNITTYYLSDDNYGVGYQIGLDEGFDLGYYEGVIDGYNDGVSESLDSVSPFNFIKDSISRFFQIRLFGDLTIGHILSLAFGLMLIGIIIKILLGG